MPLERRVMEPEGVFISGRHIQQGVCMPLDLHVKAVEIGNSLH